MRAATNSNERAGRALQAIRQQFPDFFGQLDRDFTRRLAADRDHTFISCWSECDELARTHDDLTMWRAYGGDGNGVAIVVDPASFLGDDGAPNAILACPVYYEDERSFLARAANYFQAFAINYMFMAADERDAYPDLCVEAFSELCFYLAVTHKHPAFASEKEWRFVWRRSPGSEPDMEKLVKPCTTPQGLFEKLCLPLDGTYTNSSINLSVVRSVMIGPCEDAQAKERAVRNLFGAAGLNEGEFLIGHSEIPYRTRKR